MANVLYISYDGMLEPLGRSQVLNYLEHLVKYHNIFLISYEKNSDWKNKENRYKMIDIIKKTGIVWIPMRYHKSPSLIATLYDILRGIFRSSFLIFKYRIKVVHARSYVSAVIALFLKKALNVKFIFDMRGFWADERVDGELWHSNSLVYKTFKWLEKKFILNADCIISLTKAAIDKMILFPYLENKNKRFEIITTCANLDLFKPAKDNFIKDKDIFTLGYVGSVGVWYMFDEVLKCFSILLKICPEAKLHVINRGGHEYIYDRLDALNIDKRYVLVESKDHHGVAEAMQNMDAGIFFYKPTYSKLATAPTKLGEFLGCGVPCISNAGVGDMANIIDEGNVGVIINNFNEHHLKIAINELLHLMKDSDIHNRCRSVALKYFSLYDGVKKYNQIYNSF